MKLLFSCIQSQDLDAATRKLFSLQPSQLMEKASLRIWDGLLRHIENQPALRAKAKSLRIVALCGKGDNGGDAMAVLRHAFSAGFESVQALISAQNLTDTASAQHTSLIASGIPLSLWQGKGDAQTRQALVGADIILDGVLGTGIRGPALGEAREMIDYLSDLKRKDVKERPQIVSIDIPSGMGDLWLPDFPTVEADVTLCLEPIKDFCFIPQASSFCGNIIPVSDVFPARLLDVNGSANLLEAQDIHLLLEAPGPTAYKMSRGRLSIFAGSKGSAGAALLCARAAMASGAGYISLHVDEDIYSTICPALESAVVRPLGKDSSMAYADAVLVGPGWGSGHDREELLQSLGTDPRRPLILDADAIRLLAARPLLRKVLVSPCALTPHPGELKALRESLGISSSTPYISSLAQLATQLDALVVAKSHTTWIRGSSRNYVWAGLAPELGTAGSGDVLAGLFAGLVARGVATAEANGETARQPLLEIRRIMEESARAAVIAHGIAGKNLAITKGWFNASELIEECSRLIHSVDTNEGVVQ